MSENSEHIIVQDEYGRTEKWVNADGELHRDDGPAYLRWSLSGKLLEEGYYQNGLNHRENGPALILYDYSQGEKEEYYYCHGNLHREDGPAHIQYYGNGKVQFEEWSLEGRRCRRDNGPTLCTYYQGGEVKTRQYYVDNHPHREDGPAYQEYNAYGEIVTECWYQNGEIHRQSCYGNPAVRRYLNGGSVVIDEYRVEGKLHMEKFPARLFKGYSTEWGRDISMLQYYFQGVLHNPEGPAEIIRDLRTNQILRERWFIDGFLTKEIVYENGRPVIEKSFPQDNHDK